MQVFTYAERPDLADRTGEIADALPELIHHADVTTGTGRKQRAAPELQLLLYDDEQDAVVGRRPTIPASTHNGSRAV